MNILCCCIFGNCIGYILCCCVKLCCYRSNTSNTSNNNYLELVSNFDNVIETYEKTDDEDSIICPITQEEILTGEIIKKLPCGHKYSSGISKWVLSNNSCPVCKQKIIEVV